MQSPEWKALYGPGLKGRGGQAVTAHRFETRLREPESDGWPQELDDDAAAAVATEVREEQARSILSRNDSPDIDFELSINPYRGCEHGCIYCYARPTHSYLNLSPGLDFETQIVAKHNIAEVLRGELLRPAYLPELLVIGTVTDAYQPIERDLRLTRAVLEVLHTAHHPLAIDRKSTRLNS